MSSIDNTVSDLNEQRIAGREPVVNLNGSLPLSTIRDDTQTSRSVIAFTGQVEERW